MELQPAAAPAFPQAAAALREADIILLGPGSLYTSVLPNLLIPGIRNAIRRSRARVVLILNLMTQPGETDHMNGLEHLDAIEEHAGEGLIDAVLINSSRPSEGLLGQYADTGSELVEIERQTMAERGVELVETDLLAAGDLIRHDPAKLSGAIVALARGFDQP